LEAVEAVGAEGDVSVTFEAEEHCSLGGGDGSTCVVIESSLGSASLVPLHK